MEWYRREDIREFALGYYSVFREVLRDDPESRSAVVRCRECGIFFFTYPGNRTKSDLMCPFGCSDHHRKQASNKRAAAYYQTPEGKIKKKALNARRRGERAPPKDRSYRPPRIISYLRFILFFIDNIEVAEDDAVQFFKGLVVEVRQHSLSTFTERGRVPDD